MPTKKKKPPPRKKQIPDIDKMLRAVVDHPFCPVDVYHVILDWFERDPDQEKFDIIDAVHLLESQGYKVIKPGGDD